MLQESPQLNQQLSCQCHNADLSRARPAALEALLLVLVFRIERAFRSVHEAANTLERLRGWHVGLRSYAEPWLDTTSPFGEALYYITVAYAQLETGIIAERVRSGMARARKQSTHVGRPRKVNGERKAIWPLLSSGQMSQAEAARRLRVSQATVSRLCKRTTGSAPRQAVPIKASH